MPTDFLQIARSILAQPTAPFHEDRVRGEIHLLLAQLPHVRVTQDDFGNVIAEYRRGDRTPKFAFAAHMDHPGYVGEVFMGGVPEAYRAKNPPKRDFGAFAMWDLPAFDFREGRIYSRACDDLIGCAAIVAMFHALEQEGVEAACLGIFTRAEEVGLIGRARCQIKLLPDGLVVISLETSSEKGGPAKMGEGVIVRVGDRTSVFDPEVTEQLVSLARLHSIPMQRALMQGGTCEATAYQLYGRRAGAICVALGNYHNCGPDETIAPEYVSVHDAEAMVRLCIAAAKADSLPDPNGDIRVRLEKAIEEYRGYF